MTDQELRLEALKIVVTRTAWDFKDAYISTLEAADKVADWLINGDLPGSDRKPLKRAA